MRGQELTQEKLKSLARYEDGKLICISSPRRSKVGKELATLSDSRGANSSYTERTYLKAYINGGCYYVHRLVWLYHYGTLPAGSIDHIDHDTFNNRIENLAEVSQAANSRNQNKARNNTTGFTGVTKAERPGAFVAQIHRFGKHIHLGVFDTLEEAVAARQAANKEYEFHENHGISTVSK